MQLHLCGRVMLPIVILVLIVGLLCNINNCYIGQCTGFMIQVNETGWSSDVTIEGVRKGQWKGL